MSVPFLDLPAQYRALHHEIDPAVQRVLASGRYALGPEVEKFEHSFSRYCERDFCVGVNSGTAALEILLRSYALPVDAEVITVANTFFATVEAILHVGASVVLVDCEEETALIDPHKVEAAITPRTAAIIPVHLYGQCADMDAINVIAKQHDLIVIEDACQAHGARYKGRRAGSLGHAAAFSFYPSKNLGATGEAGALVTNNPSIATHGRMLRDHGQREKYQHEFFSGGNERMDSIQGAVLNVKLPYLDAWNAKRRSLAERYHTALSACGDICFIDTKEGNEHTEHLFVIRTGKRDALRAHLTVRGIEAGIHYPIPIHLLEAMKFHHRFRTGSFPVAERLAGEILSLPMFPELTEGQVEEVCEAVRSFYA